MSMNHFIEAFTLGKKALELASSSVGLITDNTKREAAQAALEDSRRAFAIAESQAAAELDYPLCQHHWPPAICTLDSSDRFVCPSCGAHFQMTHGKAGGGL